jgi:hypothetical protein
VAATLASMSILSLSSLIRYANNSSFSLTSSFSSLTPTDLPLSSLSSKSFSLNSSTFYTLPTQVRSAVIFALSRVDLSSFPSSYSFSTGSNLNIASRDSLYSTQSNSFQLASLIFPSLLSPDAVVECIHQALTDPIPIIKFF